MNQRQARVVARAEVLGLPLYNAGLSSDAVRARFGVAHVARLASNESPFGASPMVARSLADLASSIAVYPDAECCALRQALSQRTQVPPEAIVIGNGSEEIIQMLCQAFLAPGDHVLTQSPSFGLHEIYPKMMGASVHLLPLTGELEFDVDAWCTALQRRPKIAFLCTPSNPVGCIFGSPDFERLVDATPAETLLVIDEAYHEYARLNPSYPDSLARLKSAGNSWMVLRTFSKAWGLAGLRVGYGIVSDANLAQYLHRVRTPFNVNRAAQVAALAALNDEAFMAAAARETVGRRDRLRAALLGLRVPGLRIAPSSANFLFLDIGQPNASANEALLTRGVLVKPWKETGFESFLRVSIGSDNENTRFIRALSDVLKEGRGLGTLKRDVAAAP